ncbi:MAG: hypothetical protein HOD92_13020 [Deltaproteobacteria bacterium]|jgi:16S rRNA (cytosine967-C5)-methyltransferase|nr:hypothetical protein [Deltaproteobacteria bacterium]MBT4527681.1 hypothetical protein [Deltaproteobacteria bacterium]
MSKKKIKSSKTKEKSARAYALDDLLIWFESTTIRFKDRKNFNLPANFALYRLIISNVIRYRDRYLFLIEKITKRPLKKLDLYVQVVLMIGIAQLDQEEKLDDYAVVNETVALMNYLKKPYLKGFINGSLRSYLRTRESLEKSLLNQKLSLQSSHPEWMVQRWEAFYGTEQTRLICHFNNQTPQINLVLNPKFEKEKLLEQFKKANFSYEELDSGGFLIHNPNGLFDSEMYRSGSFLVQDFSAQLINTILKPLSKKRILDACASPGGKLFNLEWTADDQIEKLVGIEISKGRFKRLIENKKRYQSQAEIICQDVLALDEHQNQFECVLLDAPCSATGTIRKHPEIKWSRQLDDFKFNQQKQLQLLNHLKKTVCQNGYLIYSTCSMEPEENQQVIEIFLKENHEQFELIQMDPQNIPTSMITVEGYYQHLPSQQGMGAFAALLKRKCNF